MRGAALAAPRMRRRVLLVAMEAHSRGPSVVERLRSVHLRMVDVVLGGEGLEGVAALAAGETGGVVAIVVPRLGAAAASGTVEDVAALRRYVGERARGRTAAVPAGGGAAGPIAPGDEQPRAAPLLGAAGPAPEAPPVLHPPAVACPPPAA